MSLTVTLNCTKIAMVSQANPNTNYSTGLSTFNLADPSDERLIFLGFEAFPNNLKNYKLISAEIEINFNTSGNWFEDVSLYSGAADFNKTGVTWNNKPQVTRRGRARVGGGNNAFQWVYSLSPYYLTDLSFAIAQDDKTKRSVILDNDVSKIKLHITYDPDVTVQFNEVTFGNTPSYVSPYKAQAFTWYMSVTNGPSYNQISGGLVQASAVFYWRLGTSGPYTAVNVSGSTQSVTIPANTFSAGTVQYYVTVTDTNGNSVSSAVRSVTTSDAAISATPIAPVNTVEDSGDVIVFRWQIYSPNGTAPTGADLEGSSNGSTWVSFGTVSGAANSFAAPANTFTAGTRYWRVRIYNADSVAGSWSAAASFISVGPPGMPAVSSDAVPFATISWQVDGQQAWRLTVDGKLYGPVFGSSKSFTVPDYLADGEHTVSVEIQGQYGLWSQPGTISFTVANTPGDAVALQAEFDVDAVLGWSTDSVTADFLIYRDGVRIGHTTAFAFADRLALGEHSYQVLNRLADGNYTLSNAVSGVLQSEITRVALFSGGAWLQLPLSERSSSEQRFDYSRSYSLRHMMGAALPVLELSSYEDGSGTYDAAFRDAAEAQAFAQLRGKLVIIKSRRGELLVGALPRVTTRQTNFYTAAEFVVQRCHYEDYVDG